MAYKTLTLFRGAGLVDPRSGGEGGIFTSSIYLEKYLTNWAETRPEGKSLFQHFFLSWNIWKQYDVMDYFADIRKNSIFFRFLLFINSCN